jgi:hypothetical protein
MANTEHTYVLAEWYADMFQITPKLRKIVPPFHRHETQLSDDGFGSTVSLSATSILRLESGVELKKMVRKWASWRNTHFS